MVRVRRGREEKATKEALRAAIARNLRDARENATPKLTQKNVAELFNPPVSRAAIAQWEIGETLPDVDRLLVLSKVYGRTIDSLIFGDDDPPRGQEELTPAAIKVARTWQRLNAKGRAHVLSLMELLGKE